MATLESVNQWFAEMVPHNRALGLRALALFDDGVLAALPYHPKIVGNPETGVIYGGAITALVDATCGISVVVAMARPRRLATLDLRIDYLRPATPGETVQCRGVCYKLTSQVAFVRALAHHGDESDAVAAAAGTFMTFGSWPHGSGA